MSDSEADTKSVWQHLGLILAGALAGGLGWGIRGQYGHETGAMMAGLLVSSVIAVGYLSGMPALFVARAMAMATIGMGIGGSETYGQTLGLTQDPRLIGNWDALRWGLIGTSVKGAAWIGFSGLFLGMALSGKLLSPIRMVLLVVAMLGLHYLGVYIFNQPYDPAKKLLPDIYFSANWHWFPGEEVAKLKPRREVWGGLLLALVMAAFWLRIRLGDRLAFRMAAWGILGGAIGFPAGQAFQAYHAWNRELFTTGIWEWLDPNVNWWNVMETTFGFVMGGVLTFGLALNRKLIQAPDPADAGIQPGDNQSFGSLPSDWLEVVLLITHCVLLVSAEFGRGGWYGDGLTLAALPLIAVCLGRYWPYWLILPITVIPIAGKTYRNIIIENEKLAPIVGAILFVVLPIVVMWLLAFIFSRHSRQQRASIYFTPWVLLVCTWMYFGLNFAFFEYPFPWREWTSRTPHAIYYFIASVYLTALSLIAIFSHRKLLQN